MLPNAQMSSIVRSIPCSSFIRAGLVSHPHSSSPAELGADQCPACALMANDEEASCSVARWFMKEFQFVTDGYRLFSAVNRLYDGKNTWFNSGPSQKYVRRQLRAMDYSLVGQNQARSTNQERASYTSKDGEGNPIHASDMDLALLILYGHILYLGKSFGVALSMSPSYIP